MEIMAEYGPILLALGVIFSLYMTWGIGANDVANAMGTSVGSGAITVRQAIIIAALFEFMGAVLAGNSVTDTIHRELVDPMVFTFHPEILAYGMLASLLASALWLMIATARGWPVSTTHSIVGAIVGFTIAGVGANAVHWSKIGEIVTSWLISPLLAGSIAFVLMLSIRHLVLNTDAPFQRAKIWGPAYAFLVGFVLSLITIYGGLSHIELTLSSIESFVASLAFGLLAAIFGKMMIDKIEMDREADQAFYYASVEKVFTPLMIFTACAMAFAHGSNDVANGVGPLAAIVSVVNSTDLTLFAHRPQFAVLLLGGVGIVMGIATMGYKVMQTMGTKITELTPTRGYCATMAAATTVAFASKAGLPVSTTHVAVGAVMGVGLARGIGAIDLRVVGGIIISWMVTLPAGAILSALLFFALKNIFS
ncbi:MAG: inorganic phosphate transporter [Magnetococcales bacterium]|nr:inorganic phosphate transporter [Magnetococcales bacterium]